VAHSIASTLLRTFSQLPVLDQKWMWQIVKLVSTVDCSLCNLFIRKQQYVEVAPLSACSGANFMNDPVIHYCHFSCLPPVLHL
jgi:hypothetical protein